MSFYKFDEDDLFVNTVEANPEFKFYIQSASVYINNYPHMSGANTDNIIGVPKGLFHYMNIILIDQKVVRYILLL